MKNIKIVTYNNFPFGGASANFVRNLAFTLLDDNVEVLLPTGNYYGNVPSYTNKRNNKINTTYYRFILFLKHPKNYLGKFLDLFFGSTLLFFYIIKKAIKNEIDLIIKYDVGFISDIFLIIIGKIFNIKLVYIIVEYYKRPVNSLFSFSYLKWVNFYLGINYLPKYSDGVIVLSHFLKNYIEKRFLYKNPLLVQPNFVDSKLYVETKNNDKNKIIGYCGVLNSKDGIYDLLKSFQILSQKFPFIKLIIIGDITNGKTILPRLRDYVSELNVEDNVQFTGLVHSSKVPNLLSNCDILVFPRQSGTFAEAGFPTKLGEYFATRKPIVATKVGDIVSYFTDKKELVLADPNNPDSLANGIEYLLLNKEEGCRIGQEGYSWMIKNLDIYSVSKKISGFINEI